MLHNSKRNAVDIIDRVTTNSWTAYPIFILVVYFIFWCTFSLGQYPMDWIQRCMECLSSTLNAALHPEWLRDLIVDGILAGIGGVLMFIPNIVILYFLLSMMESTGYLGRVAFIMDRLMHGMGLHGKSFIPMIMGFGCNVPAIMSCRHLRPKKSRLVTALIIPFMSCSGRLPVYLLFVAAFFPDKGPLILLCIYAVGLILGVCMAKILSMAIPGISSHDHVQIKEYAAPSMKYVFSKTGEQAAEYLKRIAGPILIFSVALWILGYFPRAEQGSSAYQQKEQSFIGTLGHAIDPVLEPVGLNWKDGVSFIAGVGAKELIVSTLGVMYSDGDSSQSSLNDALRSAHTPAGAMAFIIFVLLYFPCVGTFTAIKHVTGSWLWTLTSAVCSIVLAWLMAFATYNLFSVFV